jgi:invasion protein IalB
MGLSVTRLGAAALATSLAFASGAALAQNAPAKPVAPAPAGQPAPQPPSKVELVSPETQWVKLCGKEQSTGREACQTMRDFGQTADQPPMLSMQVFEMQGEEKRKLRFMILPIGMLLRPGFRVIVDKSEPIDGKYDMCFQNACTAEVDIGARALAELKKGQNLAVVMRLPNPGEPSGRELTLNIPLKDFGATFDGKPTDKATIEQMRQAQEQRNQALQQQLQKRAEEQRKMLEQQQSGAAAPATPAAPAAPAAPAQQK